MLRTTAIVLAIFAAVYVAICILAYFFQERIIFFPERLSPDHEFDFDGHHEEVFITTTGGAKLNGLLFKAPDAKGLIFYLHGNAGSLNSWGDVAATYTRLGYDVFLLDYRGYGKSEGEVTSEDELVQDVRDAYDYLLKHTSATT
jgi:alpha-beta hydrolase superfamily lysophospholipase